MAIQLLAGWNRYLGNHCTLLGMHRMHRMHRYCIHCCSCLIHYRHCNCCIDCNRCMHRCNHCMHCRCIHCQCIHCIGCCSSLDMSCSRSCSMDDCKHSHRCHIRSNMIPTRIRRVSCMGIHCWHSYRRTIDCSLNRHSLKCKQFSLENSMYHPVRN